MRPAIRAWRPLPRPNSRVAESQKSQSRPIKFDRAPDERLGLKLGGGSGAPHHTEVVDGKFVPLVRRSASHAEAQLRDPNDRQHFGACLNRRPLDAGGAAAFDRLSLEATTVKAVIVGFARA